MPDLTTIAVSILSLAVSVTAFMLFLVEHRKSKAEIDRESQQALTQAQNQSNQIIGQAVKKAQAILGQAEAEEIKLVQGSKDLSQKFEQAAQQQFTQTSQGAEQGLQKEVQAILTQTQQAHQQYLGYLTQLKSQIDQTHQDSLSLVKERVNGLFENFEQNLSNFLSETEQKTVYSIELELRATRELINTYKQQQLKLVDDNVVAILERSLGLILSKRLSLQDHADLINEALEKAKLEKFIA
jgi:hypothetical protein